MISEKRKYNKYKTHGIVILSIVPVRRKPDDRSEITTQLLFGELCEILTKKHNGWCRISVEWDNYEGWVDRKQITLISEKQFKSLSRNRAFALDICAPVYSDSTNLPILIGSTLPGFDGITLKVPGGRMRYSGQTISIDADFKFKLLRKIATKYLGSPYLWGGRSPFGIDCSGFVQNVFKFFNIRMPRDAYQQAGEGEVVHFINEIKLGDLAFFDNADGKIIHVGIILDDENIIHASGEVRIDLLDHYGIFNKEQKRYTHALRIVKRIILE